MDVQELLPLFALLAALCVLLTALYFLQRQTSAQHASSPSTPATETTAPATQPTPTPSIRRRRGGLSRMRRAAAASAETGEPIDETEITAAPRNLPAPSNDTAGKRSKKKEANREAKREAQQAHQAALQAYHDQQAAAEEAQAAQEALEAAAAEEAAAAARQQAEEREQKEREEYEAWKDLISVADAGEGGDTERFEDPALLQKFCDFVRSQKVVVLEELAAEFELSTEDVVDRITRLEEAGTLTGFFDDRGKFIYVSIDEMENVAKFIERRGRISIQDLAAESSKLLHLDTPTAAAS